MLQPLPYRSTSSSAGLPSTSFSTSSSTSSPPSSTSPANSPTARCQLDARHGDGLLVTAKFYISLNKVECQSSWNNMLLVVSTCVSRSLIQCKRNQLNLITWPRENILNVQKYWDIFTMSQNSKFGQHFGHFLREG